jgi:hypothetical protein
MIALMTEAVSICETSLSFYHTTRRNVPEQSLSLPVAFSLGFSQLRLLFSLYYHLSLFPKSVDTFLLLSVTTEWLAVVPRNRDVLGSNFGLETGYPV